MGGGLGGALALAGVAQAGEQHSHGLVAVAVLRAVVLAFGHDAGGQVGDAHGGFGLVDVLAAGTGGTEHVDAQIVGADLDVAAGLGLGHDGHGAGGGVDASLGFGDGHALHAVRAGFVAQPPVDLLAADLHDDLAVAAQLGFAGRQDLGLPAAMLGVAQVHAQQVAGKEGAFITAGAGPDLQDGVAGIVGVARQQQVLDALLGSLQAGLGVGDLLVGELAHVGLFAHLAGGLQIGASLLPQGVGVQHLAGLGVLLVELFQQADVLADVFAGQLGVEFFQPVLHAVQLRPQGFFHGDA